jgi:5-methylcytosine-specific restriction endonuclease McrA
MSESFWSDVSDEEISRERKKAKELKKTAWWKQKRSSGVCYYCNQKFSVEELTMDHIIPLIRGGKSIKANLVPSCKDCNNKKKHKLAFELS